MTDTPDLSPPGRVARTPWKWARGAPHPEAITGMAREEPSLPAIYFPASRTLKAVGSLRGRLHFSRLATLAQGWLLPVGPLHPSSTGHSLPPSPVPSTAEGIAPSA